VDKIEPTKIQRTAIGTIERSIKTRSTNASSSHRRRMGRGYRQEARYASGMPDRSRRPRDSNQLAKLVTDIGTGEIEDKDPDAGKDAAAVALGRKGGLKGGKARAENMTPEQRSEAAKRAARARWGESS